MSITLEELVDTARRTTARQRLRLPEPDLRGRAETAARSAASGRLLRSLQAPGMAVIAEVKAASPLAGRLRSEFDPVGVAVAYAGNGAAAISVLTEAHYFGGSLEHLASVAAAVDVPVLRKDFIVEAYQIYEAAAAGAAAVLLIAEVCSPETLEELVAVADSVGLDALVEVHDPESVPAAVASGSRLVGVNNRNLRTMEVEFEHSITMAPLLPPELVRVSESGIAELDQLRRLAEAGYDAALIGTSLMRADDPGAALRRLLAGGR